MTAFLVDEDFDHRIVRGLLLSIPDLDIVTVHQVGLTHRHDRQVLAWAAEHGRVLLTHDVSTITDFAYARVAAGLPMPGVFAVTQRALIGPVIANLIDIAQLSLPGEWEGQVRHLPW